MSKKHNQFKLQLAVMLIKTAEADKAKALITLELLSTHPAGIGDHSTDDFYKNAEEAVAMLADADDRLEAIQKYLM
tara:strand:+ start:810 stop:1037 length:228 start_codon:yes stop_codon:yes gene_type:complete